MRTVAVSAINIFNSGPLAVVRDFMSALLAGPAFKRGELKVMLFCHSRELYKDLERDNLTLIEKPLSRKNWLIRLFYEYVWFRAWSERRDVDSWVSLHDITPNVKAAHRYVYCHNPAPFYSGAENWRYAPGFELMRRFYKYLYRINLAKNDFVIVQQQWIRDEFVKLFGLSPEKIVVARPETPDVPLPAPRPGKAPDREVRVIYPAFPRVFKNFELLLGAMRKLMDSPVKLVLTISGQENDYSRRLAAEFGALKNVELPGFLPREELYKVYAEADAMVFPSKLETWGLPLSEFRRFDKPIFAADLPYARETLSGYGRACYFDPDDAEELSRLLGRFAAGGEFKPARYDTVYAAPYTQSWGELVKFIGLA